MLVALISPAATFVICRSAPDAPTLTTLAGFVPAKLYVAPPIVALEVGCAAPVTEPAPSATSPAAVAATAFAPIATPFVTAAFAPSPTATPLAPAAVALVPAASAFTPVAPSFL
nr:hypothetical protein [Burkholderia sp. SRS-W-2-2016]